jgi:hypothetical protein
MWVVFNNETGWSDESMRFATKGEALDFIAEHDDNEYGDTFGMRYEA